MGTSLRAPIYVVFLSFLQPTEMHTQPLVLFLFPLFLLLLKCMQLHMILRIHAFIVCLHFKQQIKFWMKFIQKNKSIQFFFLVFLDIGMSSTLVQDYLAHLLLQRVSKRKKKGKNSKTSSFEIYTTCSMIALIFAQVSSCQQNF